VHGGAAEFVPLLNNRQHDPLTGCVTSPSEIGEVTSDKPQAKKLDASEQVDVQL